MSAPASFVPDTPASFQPDAPAAAGSQTAVNTPMMGSQTVTLQHQLAQGVPQDVAARHARGTNPNAAVEDPSQPLTFGQAGTRLASGAMEFVKDFFDPRVNVVDGPNSLWNKYVTGPLADQQKQADAASNNQQGGEAVGHTVASYIPFVGPLAAQAGEQLSKARMAQVQGQSMGDTISEYAAAGLLAGAALFGSKAGEDVTDAAADKGVVTAKAHAVLENSAADAKTQLGQVAGNVGDRVRDLVHGISDADVSVSAAEGKVGSIATGRIMSAAVKSVGEKAVTAKTMPNVYKAVTIIGDMPANMTWEHAKMLRTEISSMIGKASPREQSILGDIKSNLTAQLANRATELDNGKGTTFKDSWEAYNHLHNTIEQYNEGILGKLMGTSSGLDFFNEIKKPSNGPALTALNKDLSKFGLSDNFFKELADSHKDTHFLAKQSEAGGGGMMGRIGAVIRHPVAVGVPAAVPLFLPIHGSFVLSMIAAAKAADLADRVAAAAEMRRLGVPDQVSGRFGEAAAIKPAPKPQNAQPSLPEGEE